ncbi:hypothetical protein NC651_009300, partial [Populus alba x Populus x berolinensis]
MAHVSDIKLIRTDTTLDLSQKAEKDKRSRITGFWLEGGDLAVKIKAMLVIKTNLRQRHICWRVISRRQVKRLNCDCHAHIIKRRIDPKGKIALEPLENHEKSQRGSGSFDYDGRWLVPGTQVWELEGQLMRAEVYLSIATMKCNRGRDGYIKELSFYSCRETKIRSGSVPLLQAVEFVEAPGSLLFH